MKKYPAGIDAIKLKIGAALTLKFMKSKKPAGRWPDGLGLYILVGERGKPNYDGNNQVQRWELDYTSPTTGKQRTMGLGILAEVTLAKARTQRQLARELIAKGIDPLEQRKEQEQERRRTATKTKTFKVLADEFIEAQSTKIRPWKPRTRTRYEDYLRLYLKPLYDIPVRDITSDDIGKIIKPLLHRLPPTANNVHQNIKSIIDWGYVVGAMPDDKMNPASMKGPLRKILSVDTLTPEHEPREAIPYEKVPEVYAVLDSIQPRRIHYTVGEVARAHVKSRVTIYNDIATGKLRASKPESPVFSGAWQEHQIHPDDAVARYGKRIVDVIPGLPPVSLYFLKFLILNALRCEEVTYMEWSQWQRNDNLFIIPWQRVKGRNRSGRKQIRIDHVVPLSKTSIEILQMLDEQQKRDNIPTNYPFANYMTANRSSARIGEPINSGTVQNLLARVLLRVNDNQPLGQGELSGTLHGMRTCFRSWLDVQRINGHPRWSESDMERAIAHVRGYGTTEVSRLYSRQSREIIPLIEMFDAWERYVRSLVESGEQTKVVPLHIPSVDKPVVVRTHPTKAYPSAIAKSNARFAARAKEAKDRRK